MKQFILTMLTTIVLSGFSFGQVIDLSKFKTTGDTYEVPNSQDKSTKDVSKSRKTTHTVHNLVNGMILRDIAISDGDFNHIYIVTGGGLKQELKYYIIKSSNEIKVHSSTRNLLYSIKNLNNKVDLVYNSSSADRSCFGSCMDAAEQTMTDDFMGWLAWEYSPGVQIAAAINCGIKCLQN